MKGVIIAGGKGTRLRPLTYTYPKPIVPMANKPFLEYQIELMKKHGIREVVFAVNYLADQIQSYFGDGSRYGMRFYYTREEVPLGTAGAIRNGVEFFRDEPVLVLNGDILTDADLSQLIRYHHEKKAKVTLTLVRVENPTMYGLILTDQDGRVKQFLEKPRWDQVVADTINAGIYIIEPEVWEYVPVGREVSIERETYPLLLGKGIPVYGYLTDGYWLDIGTPEKYLRGHFDLLAREIDAGLAGREYKRGIWLGEGVEIDSSAQVEGPVLIGNYAKIGPDVEIKGNVTVGANCEIEEGAVLDGCVVHDTCQVGPEASLTKCIVDRETVIEDGVDLGPGTMVAAGSVLAKGTKIAPSFEPR